MLTVPQLIERVKVRGRVRAAQEAHRIVAAVALLYGVPKQAISSRLRTQRVANARHVAAWLMREGLYFTFDQVARHLGLKDHTSALHAWRLIEAKRLVEAQFADDVDRISI